MDTRRGERYLSVSERQDERATRYVRLVKPALDRALSAIFLVLLAPVFLVIAVSLLLALGRPILYSRYRVGRDGQPFRLHKFRTMQPDRRSSQEAFHGDDRRQNHKSPDDPRHTGIGRILRSSRFDELPQLWNVLKGDMSLVGPRPELPEIVVRYEHWQHRRHAVKPGVTGLWQISDQNDQPMHECVQLDLEYLESISFRTDLSILLRTPAAMLGRRRGH